MSEKFYPYYKMSSVLGPQILGRELYKYGMPYTNAFGLLSEKLNQGILDFMFLAVDRFPEIHSVSYMPDDRILNRFEDGAVYYTLCLGNSDPKIEFLPELNDQSLECQVFLNSSPGFVDLSDHSLTKEQEFAIQCLKNKLNLVKV